MHELFSRIVLTAAIILGFAQGTDAVASTDIQMLPPQIPGATGTNCAVGGGDNVLVVHDDGAGGTSAINCNQNFTATPAGNVTAAGQVSAGTVAISGAALGPLNGASSDTVNNLRDMAECPANYALAKTSATGFNCVAVTDLVGVGTVTLPICSTGQYLFWDGTTFSCPALPPSIGNMTCPSGEVVTSFSGGQPACTAVTAPGGGQALFAIGMSWSYLKSYYSVPAGTVGSADPAASQAAILAYNNAMNTAIVNLVPAASQTTMESQCDVDAGIGPPQSPTWGQLPASTISNPLVVQPCMFTLCQSLTPPGSQIYLTQFLGNCPANATDCGEPGGDGFGLTYNCMYSPP